MSHQVRVRVVPSDVTRLDAEVKRRGAVLLPYVNATADLSSVDGLDVPFGHPWLVRPDDLDLVHRDYVPAQGYWVVDQPRCPVLEWRYTSGPWVVPRDGRLYYATGYFAEEQWVSFPLGFLDWAAGILAWTRRKFTYDRPSQAYCGPAAAELVRERAAHQ